MNSHETANDRTDILNHSPIKVAFLCHSDNLGGASVVTRRLVQALREDGVDARMIVFNKLSDDPAVTAVPGGRFMRGTQFMLERARIAFANGFSRQNLFKVSIASNGLSVADMPEVREADVIVLSWINQGLLSFKEIRRIAALGKPMVWVMHDMWNLTGICHHAYECKAYKYECGNCQFLTGGKAADLSRRILHRKKALYADVPFTFVAVSNWLAGCCRQSTLMADQDIRVIYNAFPVDSFPVKPSMKLALIPPGKRLIMMGAARLDDPIKGLPIAIDALNYIFDNKPQVVRDAMAVFFGEVRNPKVFGQLRFPYIELGRINDGLRLRNLYASAKVVLSTSLYETLPGTLIEGQASGCLPVTFGRGGQTDIVEHLKTGYIAAYKDHVDVARGIVWALEQTPDRDALHESVRERFSSKIVARSYIDLFNELLGRR